MITTQTQQTAVSPAIKLTQPPPYVAIDIETGHAPEVVILDEIANWKPPRNIRKTETIEIRREEAAKGIREKSALLDGSPITVISVALPGELYCIYTGDKNVSVDGVKTIVPTETENMMLGFFRIWTDHFIGPETILVGFNHLRFDLPRLRAAYLRHCLTLPRCLDPMREERQPVCDVMRMFLAFYTADRSDDRFISLDEVARRLGLPRSKHLVSGADAPDLYRDGKIEELCTYAVLDALTTLRAYELLTGRATELE